MVSETSDDTTNYSKKSSRFEKAIRIDLNETSLDSSLSGSSLTRVKNELQTMMDLMGPSTPVLSTSVPNATSEVDNELSKSSALSENDVASKNRRNTSISKWRKSQSTTPVVGSARAGDSNLADAGTTDLSTNNLETYEEIPAMIPHYCVNPGCMCMMGYQTNFPVTAPSKVQTNIQASKEDFRGKGLLDWLRTRSVEFLKKPNTQPCELYRINIMGQGDENNRPRRLVFDLVEGIPRPSMNSVATNTRFSRTPLQRTQSRTRYSNHIKSTLRKNDLNNYIDNAESKKDIPEPKEEEIGGQKRVYYDSNGDTRVDFYYFDHGNAQYFHTTDSPPIMMCEILAEKTERYTTRFWAEIFTSIHIAVSFCVSFILQLFKFLLYSVLRPLTVGLMQLGSDYFFKPFLTTLFNGIIQPVLIFFYNIATSLRDLLDPIAEGCGYFFRELAVFCGSMRCCTYFHKTGSTECDCDREKNVEQ